MSTFKYSKLKTGLLFAFCAAGTALVIGYIVLCVYSLSLTGTAKMLEVALVSDFNAPYKSASAVKATYNGEAVRVTKDSSLDMVTLMMNHEIYPYLEEPPEFSSDVLTLDFGNGNELRLMPKDESSIAYCYTKEDGTVYYFFTDEYCPYDMLARFCSLNAYKPGNKLWV